MNPSIFIQCPRSDLGTDYARFTVLSDRLRIAHFGKDHTGVYCVMNTEYLRFADYPEARDVFDGTAWNPIELMIWLISWESPIETATPRQVPA